MWARAWPRCRSWRRGDELLRKFACLNCQRSFEELQPRMFSFNTPYGACPECTGLGATNELDEDLVIPDPSSPSTRAPSSPGAA